MNGDFYMELTDGAAMPPTMRAGDKLIFLRWRRQKVPAGAYVAVCLESTTAELWQVGGTYEGGVHLIPADGHGSGRWLNAAQWAGVQLLGVAVGFYREFALSRSNEEQKEESA